MTSQLECNFDEASGDVLDYSGANHGFPLNNSLLRTAAGTGVDATTGTTSGTGKGLSRLGGAGSMGLITNTPFVSPSSWSFGFWQQNPGDGVWWFRLYNIGLDSGSGLLNVGGALRLRIKAASGSNFEVSTSPPAADNSWHYYAGTYDGTNGRFYIDGSLIGTTASVTTPAAIDRIDIAEHTVSGFVMDEFRIADNVWDLSTVQALKITPVGSGSTATLDLALSSPTLSLDAVAESTADLGVSLVTPVLALSGTVEASAELNVGLVGPELVFSGQSEAVGSIDVSLGKPSLSLYEQAEAPKPRVGPAVQTSSVLVGFPVVSSSILVGPAVP